MAFNAVGFLTLAMAGPMLNAVMLAITPNQIRGQVLAHFRESLDDGRLTTLYGQFRERPFVRHPPAQRCDVFACNRCDFDFVACAVNPLDQRAVRVDRFNRSSRSDSAVQPNSRTRSVTGKRGGLGRGPG